MMRKFELCFDFEGFKDEKFLIPDLLSKEEPYTGDWDGALAFQYHYNVLPGSIISRFIVRMHPHIYQHTLWRTGAVLNYDRDKALVRGDIEDKKIFIWISGSEHTRRALLAIIRNHFDAIHKTISGIKADEKVPLPEHPKVVVDYKHLLNLEDLGEESFIPEGLMERVNVKRLLDGLETTQARRERFAKRSMEQTQTRRQSVRSQPAESGGGEVIAELSKIKAQLDLQSENYAKRSLRWYLAFIALVGIVLAVLTYRLGWDVMEPWTYFIGAALTLGAYAYFAVTLREPSLRGIYDHLVEMKKKRNYEAFGFDQKKYERLMR